MALKQESAETVMAANSHFWLQGWPFPLLNDDSSL
jgi:hypothetical protein